MNLIEWRSHDGEKPGPRMTRMDPFALFAAFAASTLLALIAAAQGIKPSVRDGYAGSETCRSCHAEIYSSYQSVSMARTFEPIAEARPLEDWTGNNVLYHEKSAQYFQMFKRDDRFFQRRYLKDSAGKEIHAFEREIHFAFGSGNNERDYVHLSVSGEMTQLPVVWYSQENRWGIAPGYDRPDHYGFSRKLNFRCTFCHMSYPAMPVSTARYEAQAAWFPAELPRGIECERCHGPGARHAATGDRSAIVNPARLGRKLAMDVCMQCHLETTSAALPNSVLKIGRGVFSFRPGEALEDYEAVFDYPAGSGHDDDFNIVHQAYRLRKSACFINSEMTCTTCHDPHRVPEDKIQVQKANCAKCHTASQCTEASVRRAENGDNCAACHMPRRRTDDIVHVVMTDHKIQRRPVSDLLRVREEKVQPAYKGKLQLYSPLKDGELHLGMALVRGADVNSGVRVLQSASKDKSVSTEVLFYLAMGYEAQGNLAGAIRTYSQVVLREPEYAEARYNLGLLQMKSGDVRTAAETFQKVIEQQPRMADAHAALALIRLRQGRAEEARSHYVKALESDDLHVVALNGLGLIEKSRGNLELSRRYFEKALTIEPSNQMASENVRSLKQ